MGGLQTMGIAQPIAVLWAKLSAEPPVSAHPLVCHLLDAGHVAEAIWSRSLRCGFRNWFATALGLDPQTAGKWVAFWACPATIRIRQ